MGRDPNWGLGFQICKIDPDLSGHPTEKPPLKGDQLLILELKQYENNFIQSKKIQF